MAKVTKHDRKQERKGDERVGRRVDLLVRGDTVRVHNGLSCPRTAAINPKNPADTVRQTWKAEVNLLVRK